MNSKTALPCSLAERACPWGGAKEFLAGGSVLLFLLALRSGFPSPLSIPFLGASAVGSLHAVPSYIFIRAGNALLV